MSQAASLYHCTVMHQRRGRFAYRFSYRLFSLLLDIDRIDEVCAHSRLLRHNRTGLVSFLDRDHGPHDGRPLRPWIDDVLRAGGIELEGGRVELLALPRLWGYVFNPLSLWYCYHRDGSLRAVLTEVSNTFGEWHHYLLHENGQPMRWPVRQSVDKVFHVSPFIDMRAEYRFTLGKPTARLAVAIHQYQDDALLLIATQTGRGGPCDDRALVSALLRFPFSTFKVMALIHWQAFRLWLRRAPLFRKPPRPTEDISR